MKLKPGWVWAWDYVKRNGDKVWYIGEDPFDKGEKGRFVVLDQGKGHIFRIRHVEPYLEQWSDIKDGHPVWVRLRRMGMGRDHRIFVPRIFKKWLPDSGIAVWPAGQCRHTSHPDNEEYYDEWSLTDPNGGTGRGFEH
jgi:hypothetical protein